MQACLLDVGLDTSPEVYCMSRRPETENCTILQFWAKAIFRFSVIFRDFLVFLPNQSAGCLPDGLRLYDCSIILYEVTVRRRPDLHVHVSVARYVRRYTRRGWTTYRVSQS
jgi:hypothetical protein